jgi:hypothetical protein
MQMSSALQNCASVHSVNGLTRAGDGLGFEETSTICGMSPTAATFIGCAVLGGAVIVALSASGAYARNASRQRTSG